MPISTKHLIDKINDLSLSQDQPIDSVLLISKSSQDLETTVYSVQSLVNLPDPKLNTGRLIWVKDIQDYRYSDGLDWVRKFTSEIEYKNTIWAWGCNISGQLGDNTTTSRSSPISVVGGFTDWCQISSSAIHTAAVRQNGTLWAWGSNGNGRLGDNTIVSKASPVSVVGGFTDWCQVSAGGSHTVALRQNNTLWSWGCNTNGSLGDNTTINTSSPVSVVGGFTDWCQVSAGDQHTAAVRQNGALWAWGYNGKGQIGDNTIVNTSSPVSVVGGFTDWCQVSAGSSHTAAVRQNGTLWTWGYNFRGNLGDNTTINTSSPVSVVGGFTDWCQVSAGGSHTAAARQNGTLWAWGYNGKGQIGDNTTINTSSPVSVVGGFTDWCQVSAGSSHTAAVRQNGTLWAWGYNFRGNLGDNTTISRSSPVSVVGGFTDWCQVSAGGSHTAAVRKTTKGF